VVLLREHGGNVSAIARAAGRSRVQVHRWLRRFGLTASRFRR
jgi:transposase-like protein